MKIYKTYVVEVKVKADEEDIAKSQSTVQVYDFENKMLLFRLNLPGIEITQVEIEHSSLILVMHDSVGTKFMELNEVDDSQKIQVLLQERKFVEAKGVARNWVAAKRAGSFQIQEICAEISKLHGDHLYDNENRADLALDSYIDTIGFLNPSYVIFRYMEL